MSMKIPQVTMTIDFPCKNHFGKFENHKFSWFLLINIYFSTIQIIKTLEVTMSMNIFLTAIIQCKTKNISNGPHDNDK